MKSTTCYLLNGIILWLALTLLVSCKKEGCTDSLAINYDPDATKDNGACQYTYGCTDSDATNFDANAVKDDGSCEYEGYVMFWTDCDVCSAINVFVDGSYMGQVTGWYFAQPSAPNCQALYCLGLTLEPKSYSWSAQETSTGFTVSGAMTIVKNQCTAVYL